MKITNNYLDDLSLEVARQKFVGNPNVEITLGSAVKMPYKANSFDYVTCASSFHHHPDPEKSVREMVRVLKPDGTLLILDMCIDGPIRKLLFKIENIYHNEGKVFRLKNQEMLDLYIKEGLTHIRQSTYLYFSLITEGVK